MRIFLSFHRHYPSSSWLSSSHHFNSEPSIPFSSGFYLKTYPSIHPSSLRQKTLDSQRRRRRRRRMAISMSSLTSSFSSLSFTSQVSPRTQTLYSPPTKSSRYSPKTKSLTIVASDATTIATPAPVESSEPVNLKKLVQSRLPGGFAAQKLIGTGRRKCAIARVVIQEGTGKVIINYRDAKEYLQGNPLWLQYITVPLVTLGFETSYDVFVKAHGGGLSGQAQAISLGVARALLKLSENYRATLRQEGLLTRDSRVVERKKVGLKKARKAPQFSKR